MYVNSNNVIRTRVMIKGPVSLTGYVGTFDLVKGDDKVVILPTFLSPGLSNELACLVRIHVDMNEEDRFSSIQ